MSHRWVQNIIDSPALRVLEERLATEHRVVVTAGSGSSSTLVAGGMAQRCQRPVLYVVAHLDDADDALEDLRLFVTLDREICPQRFPALEVLPGESNVSLDLLVQRFEVVRGLIGDGGRDPRPPSVLVAPIAALMQSVPQPEALEHYQLRIAKDQQLGPAELIEWLDRAGYQRTDSIEQPGDFSIRGGIIDIYPPAASYGETATTDHSITSAGPIRLDYFGDVVESIRGIDTETMGSGAAVEQVHIIGASIERLQTEEDTTHLLSLLPDNTLVVMHEVMELTEQARGYYERLTDARGIYAPQTLFQLLTSRDHIELDQYGASAPKDELLALPVSPLMSFDREAATAVKEVAQLVSSQTQVTVLCDKAAERDRLIELLAEHAPNHNVAIEVGYLHRGFTWSPDPDCEGVNGHSRILVPHHELFHRYEMRRRIRRIGTSQAAVQARDVFIDLEAGDHVVHIEHGIARFTGLKTMTRRGKTEEYLTLEFAGRSLLHVPATQINLVQKYVGGFHGKPPLSRLGGTRWAKQKQAVADAVKDMAAEMLRVQAARASLPGTRYPTDTLWQREFEAEFPYEETEDQLASIAQVKRDMSDEQPMDRLICGDVGFGKTEIAIRAAFKAAEHGKQVAVLVPTTVLAEQHERTFRDRMADYPFRIESLSRFKSTAIQKQLLQDLNQGQIDIVIGTHRLLSKDVTFADLGMVVIDEEQRFGVEHKQQLLQFRLTADVLTLTATPIPRTLHMSMLGLRDISSLSTPPLDRRAIVTEVIPYNPQRIQQAIIRELNRKGQVFFVHNRVYNIQSVADDIKKLVPDAKIIIGHGQMSSNELERVMLAFTRREADVLVCTTIIESGIDIPTANTIFVNAADHFGLADLHQLRGRVGRYKHRAYCYLLLPKDRTVTHSAARRLKALEQYSMLGAGFKIAMRDLEIRGAGNLLGAEQSGHIAAVGYEMYCVLLEQEAKRLKDGEFVEPAHTHLELPIAGRLPRKYIPSDKYRMEAYRRLSRASTLTELEGVRTDIVEAYGPAPKLGQQLLDLTELRIALGQLEVDSLKLEGPDLIIRTRNLQKLDARLKGAPGRTTVVDNWTVYFRPPPNYLTPPGTLLAVLRKLMVPSTLRTQPAGTTGG